MANESVNATAIIGLLVGFLVVGVIGVYVGDQMIAATNLQGTSVTTASNTTVGDGNETIPADITSIDLMIVGGGGGGGAGNSSSSVLLKYGGGAGVAGTQASTTSISVTPGQWFNFTIGAGGVGVANASGTDGSASSVYINGVKYNAAGGAGGGNGTSGVGNGADGTTGYGSTHGSLAGVEGALFPLAGAGGAAAVGVGAGGGGGGAAGNTGNNGDVGGIGGRGEHGTLQVTAYYSDASANPMAASQQSIVDTFALGVTLCKILVIVSIASIVFMLLQRTGLIPKFGGGGGDEGM